MDGGKSSWCKTIKFKWTKSVFLFLNEKFLLNTGCCFFIVFLLFQVSSPLTLSLPTHFFPITLYMFLCTCEPALCTLACASLLFLNCDIKCYRLNWGTQGILSPILSCSVAPDALKPREGGLGNFAMGSAYITHDQSNPSVLKNHGTNSVL